jgi:hypothetical protein
MPGRLVALAVCGHSRQPQLAKLAALDAELVNLQQKQ